MIYKLQNGGIIKLQKGKIIPNFIDKFKLFIDLSKETKDLKGIRSTDLLKTVHKTDSPAAIRDVADRLYLTKTPLYNSTYSGKNASDLVGAINYVEETIPSLHGKKWLTVPHNSDLVPTLVDDLHLGADQINIRRNLMDRSLKYIEDTSRILADIAHKSPEYIDQIAQDIKSGKASNVQSYVRELIDQDNRFSRNMDLRELDDVLNSFKTINGRTLGGDRNKFYMNLGAGDTGYYGPFGAIYQGKPELTGDVSQWWDQRFVHIPNATITHGGLHSGYPEWIRNIHDFENGTTIHRMINMSELFPENYLVNSAHEIISTPEKGLDISPYFDINLLPPYEKYTGRFSKRGYYPTTQYKNGGIIKLQNGRTIPLGGDYLEHLQNIPETYGGSIQPSVKTEALPKKFNGSQQAARTYAEGYQKGAKPVTKAIDDAGQKIFNTTKNVAMFVPGPTGAITWLGQMGADTANGEYSKVAKDLGAAVLVGAGLKGAQVGAKAAGRALAGKGINIPWLDAYDYSALRGQYFNNAANKVMITDPKRYVFAKHRLYEPKPISPQEAATTYHFDGRISLSRPISEAELKGWPKQFRNQKRGQISASEYSGLPKGERNNGRYGDIRFIRHMDAVPELTKDGFVQVAPEENWLANFTTDQLMVPHKSYPVEGIGKNVLVISPEAFRGTTPFSLDPGDSFFINRELKIKPKHVTFISGDPQSIQLAKERGFNVETSPKLKILSELSKQATWEELQTMRPALEKRGYWFHGREYPKIKSDYVDELNRVLHTRFNRPSLKDYSNIESVTGVPTHTYSRSTAPQQSFFGPKTGYQQVIYDTTPQIEHDLMKQIGSYAHPMAESMEGYSPLFFRLLKGWTPIKKQGGKI